ncbi:hypothetical protein [Sphingobacterium bambusae]|uniref:Uncharacterized protein n=1 Tax=Sphingobacterium bambusae TaxID=662858 RepID=A0ABW6BCC5_9SPHI|nr:hypothetical protein [Sphingobacterium bambusae]WPL47070.1 hypothetical protein SCB77_13965 [Sphingobacterium bambusae]
MKTSLLLVLSCFLLLLGGSALATMPVPSDSLVSTSTFSISLHPAAKQEQHKKLHVKKASPLTHQQQDSFTEADEDFNFNRHFELQTRDILLFAVAVVWAYRPIFTSKPLPFPWTVQQAIPGKYILQRVLRI